MDAISPKRRFSVAGTTYVFAIMFALMKGVHPVAMTGKATAPFFVRAVYVSR
jgi:hypothetical protein